MPVDELLRGPVEGPAPDPSKWTIIREKTSGDAPGFTTRDARGQTYFVSFDAPPNPDGATGAVVIATKIFWALGYNQVEYFLTNLRPETITIADTAAYIELTFGNAAVDHRRADAPASYRATWSTFGNATGQTRPLGETTSGRSPMQAPAGLPTATGTSIGGDRRRPRRLRKLEAARARVLPAAGRGLEAGGSGADAGDALNCGGRPRAPETVRVSLSSYHCDDIPAARRTGLCRSFSISSS